MNHHGGRVTDGTLRGYELTSVFGHSEPAARYGTTSSEKSQTWQVTRSLHGMSEGKGPCGRIGEAVMQSGLKPRP